MKKKLENNPYRLQDKTYSNHKAFSFQTPRAKNEKKTYPPEASSDDLRQQSPTRNAQRQFFSPQAMNYANISLSSRNLNEKNLQNTSSSKMKQLEIIIQENKKNFENEKKLLHDYINILKRKLSILTKDFIPQLGDTLDIDPKNASIQTLNEISKLKSIIDQKEAKIIENKDQIFQRDKEINYLLNKIQELEKICEETKKDNELGISKAQEDIYLKLRLENIKLKEEITEKNKKI